MQYTNIFYFILQSQSQRVILFHLRFKSHKLIAKASKVFLKINCIEVITFLLFYMMCVLLNPSNQIINLLCTSSINFLNNKQHVKVLLDSDSENEST
jgi:hypothetical protein